ncbi:MAG: membrane protein insertion efficiency factor YidD [Thermodesulfobacteriota bacterium]|nr:membrane protein insertion efficiency factor YidD [Thermodesulfobacteriota bacterium]
MIKNPRIIIFFIILYIFCSTSFAGQNVTVKKKHNVSSGTAEKQENFVLYPIKFYRNYISRADGHRCPMYPSCSQYCIEAFKKHGPFLGWIMCSDRLMRCGRDETKLSPHVLINGEKLSFDPVNKNDFWWHQ